MRTDTNKKDVKSTDITIQAGRNGFKWELSYGNTALEELIWSPSVCAHFIQFSLVITPFRYTFVTCIRLEVNVVI